MGVKKTLLLALSLFFLAVVAQSDCSTLTFLTENLPDFTLGQHAHFDIEAIGGTAPYHFQITGGAMPAGLHMTGSGQIRGVPQELADTTVFITVTDSAGCDLTIAYPVRVTS
jgi:hypothetical protein